MKDEKNKFSGFTDSVFFPARANKLYTLYLQHKSLDELDENTQKQIQEKYFKKSFKDIWEETKEYYSKFNPRELERAERNPKHKMALVFRWYFGYSTRLRSLTQGRATHSMEYFKYQELPSELVDQIINKTAGVIYG